MEQRLDVEFDNEVYDNNRQVMYKKSRDKYLYRHRIYAKGNDLDKVKEIKYTLHPSFPNPIRTVRDMENNFELITWAWGEFRIKIIIITKDGNEHYRDFDFRFGDKLRDAKKNKIPFVQRKP